LEWTSIFNEVLKSAQPSFLWIGRPGNSWS